MARILIVEDEEAIADLEKDYLELSGFDVVIEKDGKEGLRAAKEEHFDMFILDIMLPGMDGFELCRKIRRYTNSPILLVSARKEDIDKIRGLGLGADDYITKPFSPGELVARVKAHLSRYEQLVGAVKPKTETLTIRGLSLDKITRRVWIAGEEKALTAREYKLLLFLMEHPGEVYSREELFAALWDNDNIGDITTVAVHIKRIREKIEPDPSKPVYIETVWGAGYRFRL